MKSYHRFVLAVVMIFVMTAPLYAFHSLKGHAIGLQNFSGPDNRPVFSAADDDPLPVSYDLRDYGRVPPIREQNPWGTCWAFGPMSAVESSYLTSKAKGEYMDDLGGAESVDLSELHVAWFVKNNYDKSRVLQPRYSNLRVDNIESGFTSMPMAYFARLDGPVLESDLPYLSYEVISRDLGYSKGLWDELSRRKSLPSYYEMYYTGLYLAGRDVVPVADAYPLMYGKPVLRITDALYSAFSPMIGYKNRTEVAKDDQARRYIDVETTKRLIMEYGAVEIGYNHEFDFESEQHKSYYYPNAKTANHSVAVIGWDDNFPKENFVVKPSIDGAWLVRNNWGVYPTSDNGYFWMSYEQYIQEGVAYVVQGIVDNLKVYEHDPLGACDYLGKEGQKTFWAANTFKVDSEGDFLGSISFYTTENNTACEWQVFYDLPNKPETGPYVAGAVSISGSATFANAGYHTVHFQRAVELTKGHYLTVVVKYTNSYSEYPVAVETKIDGYSDFAVVHDGESWFSDDGVNWTDGTEEMVYIDDNDKKLVNLPMNACIKAFVYCDTLNPDTETDREHNTIMGLNVNDYPENIFDVSGAMREIPSRDQKVFMYDVNDIPDEPLSERLIAIMPADTSLIPVSYAQALSSDYESRDITFYLVNKTQAREFTQVYQTSTDTRFPTGLIENFTGDYKFMFEPGYEPDEFWRTEDNFEFPVYGPFTVKVNTVLVPLDVNNLQYAANALKEKGAVTKGYYDFVYTDNSGGKTYSGAIEIRLAATNLSAGTDSEDIPVTPQKPDGTLPVDSGDITPVSNPGSSGGGCDSGAGIAGIALLLLMRRKRY